ncbi:MAG TPA: cytochrome C [Patescibacteria group bacterium]|nr:cytochrome C [Patescibacteria group bacterium]
MELKDTRPFVANQRSQAWLCAWVLAPAALLFMLLAAPPPASAVPSFARQTGLPCSACHINPPELTPLGRQFKLAGYTMTGIKVISAPPRKNTPGLELLSYLPLAAWLEASTTGLNKPVSGSSNWDYSFPQDVSLFLAGAFTAHAGGFIQATYDIQDDHFSWDNTDVRYARSTMLGSKSLTYGIDLNNNPTVEDLWNDTPAWGFPWVDSPSAPGPAAATIIDGTLGQDVAGIGGYAMLDNHLYGAVLVYRSSHVGNPLPNTGDGFGFNIRGVAPYWRAAWQQTAGNNYLEVGAYGMHMRSTPGGIIGPTDAYTDVAVDSQYERVFPKLANDILTIHTTYIHENSTLDASLQDSAAAFADHHLDTFRINGVYHFGYRYEPSIGYFITTGTADPLLYGTAVDGNPNGDPKNAGVVFNFTYWPVQNVRLAAQYTAYTQFNGGGANYDGLGRNASDNNSMYLDFNLIF